MKFAIKLFGSLVLTSVIASATTVATVNGKKITTEEVDAAVFQMTRGQIQGMPQEKLNELRFRVTEGLIAKELIYEDAKKKKLFNTKEYKEEYAKNVEVLKEQLLVGLWERDVAEGIEVSDSEAKEYYEENKQNFKPKQLTIDVSHIIVKTEKEAKDIIKQLDGLKGKALEDKFVKLVEKYSTGGRAKQQKGRIGPIQKGQVEDGFWVVAKKTKKGTISTKPAKTPYGYHVILVNEVIEPVVPPFKKVEAFIKNGLKMEKVQEEMKKEVDKLKDKAKIKYGE
jgi:peptidyl-prolyl cis-trans isomerase C